MQNRKTTSFIVSLRSQRKSQRNYESEEKVMISWLLVVKLPYASFVRPSSSVSLPCSYRSTWYMYDILWYTYDENCYENKIVEDWVKSGEIRINCNNDQNNFYYQNHYYYQYGMIIFNYILRMEYYNEFRYNI